MKFTLVVFLLVVFLLNVLSENIINFPGCEARHIVQIAAPRTASTFGWYILCSIMRVCARRSDPAPPVHCYDVKFLNTSKPGFYVAKDHHDSGLGKKFYIFKSYYSKEATLLSDRATHKTSVYDQIYLNFVSQSLAQVVREYTDLFKLTSEERGIVYEHMRDWTILRQCCGFQASVDQRLKLHGRADLKHHKSTDIDDPRCDIYNLDVIEASFLNTRLAQWHTGKLWTAHGYESKDGAIRKGYCNRTNNAIKAGADFNHKRYRGGDLKNYKKGVGI